MKERILFTRLLCSNDFNKSPPFLTSAVKLFMTANMYQIWLHLLKSPEREFKGLLNFVRERIKHVGKIRLTRYSFKKSVLVQASKNTVTHTSKLKSMSKYQLLTFHLFVKTMIFCTSL